MKRVLLLTCILMLNICGKTTLTEQEIRENVINTAAMLLGSPYKSGGSNSGGFDCSGFVRHVMEANSIKISRSSDTQINDGWKVPIETVKPGDILIFKGANKNSKKPGHSTIVHHIDDSGVIHFIHSASSKGITIDNMAMEYYKSRFIEARDVIGWSITKSSQN